MSAIDPPHPDWVISALGYVGDGVAVMIQHGFPAWAATQLGSIR